MRSVLPKGKRWQIKTGRRGFFGPRILINIELPHAEAWRAAAEAVGFVFVSEYGQNPPPLPAEPIFFNAVDHAKVKPHPDQPAFAVPPNLWPACPGSGVAPSRCGQDIQAKFERWLSKIEGAYTLPA